MKKHWYIPVIIIVGLLCVILPVVVIAFTWGTVACAMYSHIDNAPSPDKPSITRAEFPFTLVYERDGEEITVNDTLICEYKGDRWSDGHNGKFRYWEESYASGIDDIILAEKNFDGYDVSIVFVDGYTSAYLMGDFEHYNYDDCSTTCGAEKVTHGPLMSSTSSISKDKMYEEYGVRIISFEMHAEPIENSFGTAE